MPFKKNRSSRRRKRPIESYKHGDKQHVNKLPVKLVTPETAPDAGQKKKTYTYDPHLHLQLAWAGNHTGYHENL